MVDQLIGVSDISQAKPEEDPLLVGEAAIAVLEVPGVWGGGNFLGQGQCSLLTGSLIEDLLHVRHPARTCCLLSDFIRRAASKSLVVLRFQGEATKAQKSQVTASHTAMVRMRTSLALSTLPWLCS